MIDLSAAPYYDDFDKSKNYHKILFVPGRPVQARELTQIQSVLQHQIKLGADYMFKNGAMIIPGNVSFLNRVTYIKLSDIYNSVLTDSIIDSFIGQKITGETTDVKAVVIHAEKSTSSEPPVLFINYISGGTGSYTTFLSNEVITFETTSLQILNSTSYTGQGSLASIEEGVYYINGFYVQNIRQVISLDKFGIVPTYRVGLSFNDAIVTAYDDPSLKDIAIESNNYGAVGADRYQINLTLSKRDLFADQINTNTTSEQFIDLLHVKDGQVQFKVNKTELAEFEKTLARRTYDESGDYIVDPFKYDIFEYRNNNRGTWEQSTIYVEGDIVSATVSGKTQYFVALTNGTSSTVVPDVSYGEYVDGDITWLATNDPKFNLGFSTPTAEQTIDEHIATSNLGIYKISDGKAYIKGYEVGITGYRTVTFNKAREYKHVNSSVIDSDIDTYLLVDNVKGLPSISYIDALNKALPLYNIKNAAGTTVGSCRVRNIEYSTGTIGQLTCQYRLSIFDIVMNTGYTFADDAKKITSAANASFSSNIVGTRYLLSGGVKTTGSSTTLEGNGTLFSIELKVGNAIVIGGNVYRVQTITDSVILTIDRAVDLTAYTEFYLEQTAMHGAEKSLIVSLPKSFIRTVRGADDNAIKTTYYVKRVIQQQAVTGSITINLLSVDETFAPIATGNYLVSLTDGTGVVNTATFNLVNSTTLSITGLSGSNSYRILTTVKKTSLAAKEKQKIRKVATITLDTLNSVDKQEILLSEADVVNVVSITQSGGTQFDFANRTATIAYSSTNEINISSRYKLDTGQTPYFYGLGKVIPQNGFIPSAPIRITYEYYDHTEGDYFSVDSYDVPYNYLPVLSNGGFAANYLDFRSRVSDSGTEFDITTGASISEPISYFYDLQTEYSYFLPRRDIIQIDPTGTLRVEEGVSNDQPVAPIANDNNVILVYSELAPYTVQANSQNVKLTINPLRRYTMKDIGSIDNRLSNVEYYTSLNALEKATAELQVKDEFGLDRYKNGFIVDQFKDHGVGDVSNSDYKCAIDSAAEELRPRFYAEDVKLLEKLVQSRSSNNYQITGDIVTLPYTSVPLIEQKIATGSEFVTPYTHLRSLFGDLNIFPASDTWVDTETAPDVHQQSEGNFGFIQGVAQKQGMLGTVWNSWQNVARTTANTRTSTSSSWQPVDWWTLWQWGFGWGGTGLGVTSTIQTGTDLVTQRRTGTETFVQERWDEVGRTTNIVDEYWSPWMREKAIVLYAKRMMPNVFFTAYIDNIDLGSYITPASTIRFTDKVGTFTDYNKSNFDQADLVARKYGSNDYDILERGEVLKGRTSGATCIVICEELQMTSGVTETVLKIVNVKGTFTNGETIVGQTSGASAVFSSLTVETNIRTNSAGSFYGILMIPNNNQVKVPASVVTISLRDNIDVNEVKTKAETEYDAHGITQVKQTTIMSVRNGVIATRAVTDTRQVTENWARTVATSWWVTNCNCNCACGDPLAQTFTHSDDGGVFVTKMDLYFHTVDQDPAMGITLQIREVINGYPGPKVVPFSQVTKMPHEITASKTELIPTTFEFQSPVYLEKGTEYCFVLATELSNSKVWISKMGEVSLSGEMIIKQPYMGSFFRSQNNRTWDADQLSDMCFTLYKAKFDVTSFGKLSLKNNNIGLTKLDINPFKIVAGSTTVRVRHQGHGLINGSQVTFSGATSSLTAPTATHLNSTFTVSNVELDSYTIVIPVAATNSGWFGGESISVRGSYRMDTMFLRGNDFVLPGTHINYTFRSSEQVGTKITKSTVDYPIQVMRNYSFTKPQFVLNYDHEAQFLNGDNSLQIDAYLYSSNENLSPVIDLMTYSVHAVSNRINNPGVDLNLSIDANTLFVISSSTTGTIVFDDTTKTITFSGAGLINYFDELDAIKVGRYIAFTGTTSNNANVLVTKKEKTDTTYIIHVYNAVDETVTNPSSLSLKQYEYYVDPIVSTDSTSNEANYITRTVQLSKQSTGFKLIFDYNKPQGSYIDVYYKVGLKSAYSTIATDNWIAATTEFLDVQNFDTFIEHTLDANLDTFDQVAIKLVFRSNNTSLVPRIKNLRLLALA